jgi:hypothetical protein
MGLISFLLLYSSLPLSFTFSEVCLKFGNTDFHDSNTYNFREMSEKTWRELETKGSEGGNCE